MQNSYSEDELIEQPTIALLAEMGWETLNCYSEFNRGNSSCGRHTKSEVVLISRLQPALKRLNPNASQETITKAIEELTRSRSLMSSVEANRDIYTFLKEGVRVTISDPEGAGETVEVLQVIDWEHIEHNDFFAASQLWITGEMYTKRPDIVCFVNGIPLVLMEFKRIDLNLYTAYNDNLRDYKDTIPHLFWYTQGSGKSISMLFLAQKVLRKVPGNWTFVVVTDRTELDNQTYKTFASTSGVLTQQEVHAESVLHLRQLLSEDHRYIFTFIQKFQTQGGERHPVLSKQSDIVVMTDEAHRSQYDTLALNMRTALPNAAFIAFTGTPLMVGEEKTKSVFGDYVSVYNFNQSIVDRATVPLYYENRVPTLQLLNEDFNEDIEQILEDAELDEAQEVRIEREFGREYHLITREDRLETIAEDIVAHFMGRGYQGKAMVISIDKATAVKMFDKVQKYWKGYIERLKSELIPSTGSERIFLAERIRYMEATDMAVVVSPGQNEIDDLRQKGVDIVPHRTRMNSEDLDTKFKDPEDPFRIVFVCAMWITGFDVPSCSTIYLDKPQRNHTLMQTIARANRVFGDKNNGLIVDYIGVFRDLEKALAIYATGADAEGNQKPIADKSELVEKLRAAIADITEFCESLGIDLGAAQTDAAWQNISHIHDAMERILINDETKKRYLQSATNIIKLYKAILPDPNAHEFTQICQLINTIAQKIRHLVPPADISSVVAEVENLLDQSIAPESYLIQTPPDPYTPEQVDLSQIDFEQLREQFGTVHKRIEAERLKGAINAKLASMIRLNRSRMDYQGKFEQMIAEYNTGTLGVQDYFEQLFDFADELHQEDQRIATEDLSEEELAVFDLLTRHEPHLTVPERDEVKIAVKRLLETLKQEKLVLDWRKRTQAKADVKDTVNIILDAELPQPYTPELFGPKTEVVYQHIYDSYYGEVKSIYTENL